MRDRTIDLLFVARTQHTRWVADVRNNRVPKVEKEPTKCEFGRWLFGWREALIEFDAFDTLDGFHTELHIACKRQLLNPDHATERDRVIECSKALIENIDRLEQLLRRANVRSDDTRWDRQDDCVGKPLQLFDANQTACVFRTR